MTDSFEVMKPLEAHQFICEGEEGEAQAYVIINGASKPLPWQMIEEHHPLCDTSEIMLQRPRIYWAGLLTVEGPLLPWAVQIVDVFGWTTRPISEHSVLQMHMVMKGNGAPDFLLHELRLLSKDVQLKILSSGMT